jgi:hypothetical protein
MMSHLWRLTYKAKTTGNKLKVKIRIRAGDTKARAVNVSLLVLPLGPENNFEFFKARLSSSWIFFDENYE